MSCSLQWSRLPSTPSPSVDNRSLRSRDPSHFWNPQKPIHQGNWSAPFNQPSVKAKLSHPPPPSSLTPVPLQSPHHRLYWFQFPPLARVKGVGEWASFNHWYTARGGIMTPPPHLHTLTLRGLLHPGQAPSHTYKLYERPWPFVSIYTGSFRLALTGCHTAPARCIMGGKWGVLTAQQQAFQRDNNQSRMGVGVFVRGCVRDWDIPAD